MVGCTAPDRNEPFDPQHDSSVVNERECYGAVRKFCDMFGLDSFRCYLDRVELVKIVSSVLLTNGRLEQVGKVSCYMPYWFIKRVVAINDAGKLAEVEFDPETLQLRNNLDSIKIVARSLGMNWQVFNSSISYDNNGPDAAAMQAVILPMAKYIAEQVKKSGSPADKHPQKERFTISNDSRQSEEPIAVEERPATPSAATQTTKLELDKRLSDAARAVLQSAKAAAMARSPELPYVGTADILLGVLDHTIEGSVVDRVFRHFKVDVSALRSATQEFTGPGLRVVCSGPPPFGDQSRRVVDTAMRLSGSRVDSCADLEHLLLGLLSEKTCKRGGCS